MSAADRRDVAITAGHRSNGRVEPVTVTERGTLTIHSWGDQDARCVALFGELDMATVSDLRRALREAAARGTDVIMLDLSRLDFIDSSGIAAIVAAHRELRQRLLLLRAPRATHRVFEITGLDRSLPFVNG